MSVGSLPLALIASVARNRVIGNDNGLVWDEPADKRYFREQTMGCPVVMGRKTWDSLPERFRPLPGRPNIVVTRQAGWSSPGAQVAHSLDSALQLAASAAAKTVTAQSRADRPGAARTFVIGGSQLYAQALPLADELLLTEIDADLPGDVLFPTWDHNAFTETQRQLQRSTGAAPCNYAFVIYQRQR